MSGVLPGLFWKKQLEKKLLAITSQVSKTSKTFGQISTFLTVSEKNIQNIKKSLCDNLSTTMIMNYAKVEAKPIDSFRRKPP